MGKLNKESLINWGSTNKVINKKNVSIFTKKNTTYFVSLFLCIFLAFYFSLEKENFLVNVNKTTELYSIKENGVISNNYILTIHNTQDKDYTFDIRLVDNKNFRIKRFDSFDLKAAEKTKRILILETTEDFKKLKNKPSNISIEIFTKDDEKIKVKRQIAFFYPKN
jgi:polyferredoxin